MASGHSNVVCFYGSFPLVPGKIIGIVMEHCDGNLKENMISSMETDNGRPRSLDEVSKLMRQIYKGLEHLHSLGIVHRYTISSVDMIFVISENCFIALEGMSSRTTFS